MTRSDDSDQVHDTVPINECPDCQYSLKGLPDAGKCPECGFAYDSRTVKIPLPRFSKMVLVFVAICVVSVLFLRKSDPVIAFVNLVTAIGLLAMVRYMQPKFVISPNGLQSSSWGRSRWIPWARLRHITVGRMWGMMKIKDDAGQTVLWIPVADLGGRRAAVRLKNLMDAKRDAYGASTVSPSNDV